MKCASPQTLMNVLAIPTQLVESTSILLSRSTLGDETTLDASEKFLSEDYRQKLAQRHSHQVSAMLETRMETRN